MFKPIAHSYHRRSYLQTFLHSLKTTEIDQIYIEGCTNPGYFKKATLYDYLKSNPNSIYVDISPYPYLMPALSSHNEKYVRSEPNDTPTDNLLRLPRS